MGGLLAQHRAILPHLGRVTGRVSMALLMSSRCALAAQRPAAAPAAPSPRCRDILHSCRAPCVLAPARRPASPLRGSPVRAMRDNSSEATPAFDLQNYMECRVHNVEVNRNGLYQPEGHIINLRILERPGVVLPVHVGAFEISALQEKLLSLPTAGRPLTHDLYKQTLELLGYRITRVLAVYGCVHNVYLARLHLSKPGRKGAADELELEARPSDAINMAVRFNAPMYVRKDIAMRNLLPSKSEEPESAAEIRASCKQEIVRFNDPTFELKLKMAVAIADERFADAARLRDQVERLLANDRALALIVAMESALDDDRLEEALELRNSFRQLVRVRMAGV